MSIVLDIFLDIDGCLNAEADWKDKFAIRSSCVHILGQICEMIRRDGYKPVIILSSTWRAGIARDGSGVSSMQMEGLEKALACEGLSIYDSTPVSNKGRQAEIGYYLRRHGEADYIIIDDDPSLFETPETLNLLVPDYKTGLVEKDFAKAKALLKRIRGR